MEIKREENITFFKSKSFIHVFAEWDAFFVIFVGRPFSKKRIALWGREQVKYAYFLDKKLFEEAC